MTIQYKSWVSETGTLTGTDPAYTLPGTASTPSGNQFFRKVSAAFTTSATVVLTLTSATGAETSVWTYTPGASGAPGTIARVTLLESSTGSTINWSGVAANISGDIPAPASVSAGASSAGLVPALGSTGLLDSSMLPVNGGIVTTGLVTGYWYGMRPSTVVQNLSPDPGYIDFAILDLQDTLNTYSSIAVNVTTAPTAATTLRLGIFSSINGAPGTLIFDAGDITITATGVNAISLTGCPKLQGQVWGAVGNPSTINGMQITGYSQYGNTVYYKDLGALSPFQTSNNTIGYIKTWTFGSLPATASASSRNGSPIVACQLQA
jgi:hypothetical protein